jgi:hypothetical protein
MNIQTSILSRRNDERKVDFRVNPDAAETSPGVQLRRLSALLESRTLTPDDLECDDAIEAWREYLYRKIFTGTTHEQFVTLDRESPESIDWQIAVAGADTAAYKNNARNK